MRPSKKNIKAAIEELKSKDNPNANPTIDRADKHDVDSSKKSSMRIRKQGI